MMRFELKVDLIPKGQVRVIVEGLPSTTLVVVMSDFLAIVQRHFRGLPLLQPVIAPESSPEK